MILKQKRGFHRRTFELNEEKLTITTKSPGESKKWSVHISQIGDKRFYKRHSRFGKRILGFFFLSIAIALTLAFIIDGDKNANLPTFILGLIFSCGLGILSFKTPLEEELILKGGSETIGFILNSPSANELEYFIDEIITKNQKILLKEYGTFDPAMTLEDQTDNLFWLKSESIISPKQYERMKQEFKENRLVM